jgi:hypothetical protein
MKGIFTNLRLDVLDDKPGFFCVVDEVSYSGPKLIHYSVEAGFETDLASIPAILRPFFSKTGKSRKAAVFHDHMYHNKWKTRKECDDMFHQMLIDLGVSKWKAWMYWAGVRAGGWTRGNW